MIAPLAKWMDRAVLQIGHAMLPQSIGPGRIQEPGWGRLVPIVCLITSKTRGRTVPALISVRS